MTIQKRNGSRPVSIMLQTALMLTIMAADVGAMTGQSSGGPVTGSSVTHKRTVVRTTPQQNLMNDFNALKAKYDTQRGLVKKLGYIDASGNFIEYTKIDAGVLLQKQFGDAINSVTAIKEFADYCKDIYDTKIFNLFKADQADALLSELTSSGPSQTSTKFSDLLKNQDYVKYNNTEMGQHFKLKDAKEVLAAVGSSIKKVSDLAAHSKDYFDKWIGTLTDNIKGTDLKDLQSAISTFIGNLGSDKVKIAGAMVDKLVADVKTGAKSKMAALETTVKGEIQSKVTNVYSVEKYVGGSLLKDVGGSKKLSTEGELLEKLCKITGLKDISGNLLSRAEIENFITALSDLSDPSKAATNIAAVLKNPDFVTELQGAEDARQKALLKATTAKDTADNDVTAKEVVVNQAQDSLTTAQGVLKTALENTANFKSYDADQSKAVQATAETALKSFITGDPITDAGNDDAGKADTVTGPLKALITKVEEFIVKPADVKAADFTKLIEDVETPLGTWLAEKNKVQQALIKTDDVAAQKISGDLTVVLTAIRTQIQTAGLVAAETAVAKEEGELATLKQTADTAKDKVKELTIEKSDTTDAAIEIGHVIKSVESYLKLNTAITDAEQTTNAANVGNVRDAVKALKKADADSFVDANFSGLDTPIAKLTALEKWAAFPATTKTLQDVLEAGGDNLYADLTTAGFTSNAIEGLVQNAIKNTFSAKIKDLELSDVFKDTGSGGGTNTKTVLNAAEISSLQTALVEDLNAAIADKLKKLTVDQSIADAVDAVKGLLDDTKVGTMGTEAADDFEASNNSATINDLKTKLTVDGASELGKAITNLSSELKTELALDKVQTPGSFLLKAIQDTHSTSGSIDTLKTNIQDAFGKLIDAVFPEFTAVSTVSVSNADELRTSVTDLIRVLGDITDEKVGEEAANKAAKELSSLNTKLSYAIDAASRQNTAKLLVDITKDLRSEITAGFKNQATSGSSSPTASAPTSSGSSYYTTKNSVTITPEQFPAFVAALVAANGGKQTPEQMAAKMAQTGALTKDQIAQLPAEMAKNTPNASVDQQGGQPSAQVDQKPSVDQQGGQPSALVDQQAVPKKTISGTQVLAEVEPVDSRVGNITSLNNYTRLAGYIGKAGRTLAQRVKYASENPNWLAGLTGWHGYIAQQLGDLKGQKSTLKTRSAIRNLNKMINLAKRVLDKMGNVPVVAEPKEVNGVARPAKLTLKQKRDEKERLRLENAKKQKEERAAKRKEKEAAAAEKRKEELEARRKKAAAVKPKGKAAQTQAGKPKEAEKAAVTKAPAAAVKKARVPIALQAPAKASVKPEGKAAA